MECERSSLNPTQERIVVDGNCGSAPSDGSKKESKKPLAIAYLKKAMTDKKLKQLIGLASLLLLVAILTFIAYRIALESTRSPVERLAAKMAEGKKDCDLLQDLDDLYGFHQRNLTAEQLAALYLKRSGFRTEGMPPIASEEVRSLRILRGLYLALDMPCRSKEQLLPVTIDMQTVLKTQEEMKHLVDKLRALGVYSTHTWTISCLYKNPTVVILSASSFILGVIIFITFALFFDFAWHAK